MKWYLFKLNYKNLSISRYIINGMLVCLLTSCGFHLKGNNYKTFQYPTVSLDCRSVVICNQFTQTVVAESLTVISESSETLILIDNEDVSREAISYNSTGQVSNYLLKYQITAHIIKNDNENSITLSDQKIVNYNNSLILSAQLQEDEIWKQLHENVIGMLIRRLSVKY